MKKLLTTLMALVILASTATTAMAATMYPASDWFKPYIEGEGYFTESPTTIVTRKDVANFVSYLISDAENLSSATEKDLAVPATFNLNNYVDVNGLTAAEIENVEFLVYNNIIRGTSDTTLKLDNNVRRSEIAQIIFNLENEVMAFEDVRETKMFCDVSSTDWFYVPVNEAVKKGLLNGTSDTTFNPNGGLTIEQLATIGFNMAEASTSDSLVKLTKDDVLNAMNKTFGFTLGKYTTPSSNINYEALAEEYSLYDRIFTDDIGIRKLDVLLNIDLINTQFYFRPTEASAIQTWQKSIIATDDSHKLFDSQITVEEIYDNANLEDVANYIFLLSSAFAIDEFDSNKDYVKTYNQMGIIPQEIYDKGNDYNLTSSDMLKILVRLYENEILANGTGHTINHSNVDLPKNADIYPYILNGIDAYYYELPYFTDYVRFNTIETYENNSEKINEYLRYFNRYVQVAYNIDYRTIDAEEIYNQLSTTSNLAKIEIQNYVDYVKENEIILEMTAKPILPVMYVSELSMHIRHEINLKIINSKTDKQLLLGDLGYADITYVGNDITFVTDVPFSYQPGDRYIVRYAALQVYIPDDQFTAIYMEN